MLEMCGEVRSLVDEQFRALKVPFAKMSLVELAEYAERHGRLGQLAEYLNGLPKDKVRRKVLS